MSPFPAFACSPECTEILLRKPSFWTKFFKVFIPIPDKTRQEELN